MSKVVGICGFFRHDQVATGAYSFVENLLRGMVGLRRTMPINDGLEVVVFQGLQGIPLTDEQLRFCQIADRWGRWPAEARAAFFNSKGFDGILFPNTFTPPLVRAKRAVTVIHDLQYLHLPEHWPLAKRAWMRACHEITLRKCNAVVAISQTVKDDILAHYGHRWESKVHAIWNPVSLDRFDNGAEQPFTNGRPYILCAGVDRPAKNLSTLIRAFARLNKRMPDYSLVLVGQLRSDDRTWRRRSLNIEAKLPSTVELVKELGLTKHVVVTGFIPDAQLGSLYRGASLFVLPSLFEGFGMPAVESLALGTPTLVSDLPVLREVTLNRANYIANPLDADEVADQIAQLLTLGDAVRPHPDLCREIRERFAPETIAKKYLNLLLGEEFAAEWGTTGVEKNSDIQP